ncbi:MAG: hypothetical protein ABSF52_07570 [Syntrophobacteraceae bacterium]|jgi:hypothetical protein
MAGIAPCQLRLTQCSEFANAYRGAASLPDPEAPVQTKGATGAAILLIARHMHHVIYAAFHLSLAFAIQ